MRRLIPLLILVILLAFPLKANGQVKSGYVVEDFSSKISVEKDTSLLVTETIVADFYSPKHGIFRIIPVVYSARGKTIKAKFDPISISDELGNPHEYSTSRLGQSIQLKIGDPDKTITGSVTYVIKYKIEKVIQSYEKFDEVYWNVTGAEWDTDILRVSAKVVSPYASIAAVDCYAGAFGTKERECQATSDLNEASFTSTIALGSGKDLTIIVGLNKGQLAFPGLTENIIGTLVDNWGYSAALIPFLIIAIAWLKKGRDKRYLSDNIYYEPKEKATKTVPLFARKHLPLVYSPIQGLTPAQVGTIIDERVDIHDVVAEIVELARLGYIKIKKIEKKGALRKKTDYSFTKLDKDAKRLRNYQKYLFKKLFEKTTLKDNYVLLSDLKNKFYKHLENFKKKLYQNMVDEKLFPGNPEKVRTKWIILFVILFIVSTGNPGPLILSILTAPVGVLFAVSMPRKTAKGYSLFRQIEGLRWYLKKGKWRYEIAEKHLFFEEILPLAISLDVINKLAKDMADLGVSPPSYFTGMTTSGLAADMRSFQSQSSGALASSPSGRSSWSGGSGFGGGGGVGGGFGGGGGGGW
jgi:uncharacterized membrane protein YgcG